jgi:hypothetical protein
MTSRALPLLLLVVMFTFFTGEMWQAAGSISEAQLWLVVGFLGLVAAGFLVTTFSDELPALRAAVGSRADVQEALQSTPLAGTPVGDGVPLSWVERFNIAVVLFLAQALQIVAFAVLVFVFFLVFGSLMLLPQTQAAFAGGAQGAGTLLGMSLEPLGLPLSHALVQVSLFLAVFSGLYFTASTTGDPAYRRAFFEPLLDDVALSLAARDAYRTRWPAGWHA